MLTYAAVFLRTRVFIGGDQALSVQNVGNRGIQIPSDGEWAGG